MRFVYLFMVRVLGWLVLLARRLFTDPLLSRQPNSQGSGHDQPCGPVQCRVGGSDAGA